MQHEFEITDEDYDKIDEMSYNRWSTKKGKKNPTSYNLGFKNTPGDPHRTEREGIAAEFSHGLYYDCLDDVITNSGYKEGGDEGWDGIDDNNEKVDVKGTGMRREFWITVEDKDRVHEIDADWYEGATVEENREDKLVRVRFKGRISREKVEALPNAPGRRGSGDETHIVRRVLFSTLEPLPERSDAEMSDRIDSHE